MKIIATVANNGAIFVKAIKEFNVDAVLAVPEEELDPDSDYETTEADDVEDGGIGYIAEFVEINQALVN